MLKSSHSPSLVSTQHARFHFIDDLRGIAAVAVALSHFVWLLPFPFTLLEYGRLGVEIFFVISGFVMAYSLRNQSINGRFFANFFLRRSIRLDPPYWVALILELIILFLWSAPLPTFRALLLNLAYLQDIFQVDSISSVAWTLCLELQFYLVFVFILGLCRSLSGRVHGSAKWVHSLLFGALAGLSLMVGIGFETHPIFGSLLAIPGLFLPYWHFFFGGVLINWVLFEKAPAFTLWAYFGISFLITLSFTTDSFFPYDDLSPLFGIFVGVVVYVVGKTAMFKNGLQINALSYFGRISYSLYLLHVPIGVNLIYWVSAYSGTRFLFIFPTVLLAFFASVIAAHFLHKYVEAPSVALGIRAKSWSLFAINPDQELEEKPTPL